VSPSHLATLQLCPKKSLAAAPFLRAQHSRGQQRKQKHSDFQSNCRCWITGKVSSPLKISFGGINTLVNEVLSDLQH
jgi:hypothetical protein